MTCASREPNIWLVPWRLAITQAWQSRKLCHDCQNLQHTQMLDMLSLPLMSAANPTFRFGQFIESATQISQEIGMKLRFLLASMCFVAAIAATSSAQNEYQANKPSNRMREKAKQFSLADTAPQDCRICLLYTSPSPRDQRGSRMPSSA